jgi:hypothetical protein
MSLIAIVLALPRAVYADADLDAAKARADLQEQLKRESDAKAAMAKNQADIANAEASAKASLAKAQADALKARQDYYQSMIPDPSKYKIPAPSAPKLAGSGTRMSFDETSPLAASIGETVRRAAGAGAASASDASVCDGNSISIVRADAGTRTLLALSMTTRTTLDVVTRKLAFQRTSLETLLSGKPVKAAALEFGAAVALGELAASFATILKPQYAFDTMNEATTAGPVLQAKVYGALSANPCVRVVEPDAILTLVDLPAPGQNVPLGTLPDELQLVHDLQQEIEADRKTIKSAEAKVTELLDAAAALKKDKKTAAAASKLSLQAEQIQGASKALATTVDDVEKSLAAMFAADAQGNTPIDSAVRGGVLRRAMVGRPTFSLTLKAISSDVDVVAKDCLFCRLKVELASNTIVSWQLIDDAGRVRSSGAIRKDTPLTRVELP